MPEPRYVVRELEGYKIHTDGRDHRRAKGQKMGLTVWVADEWYNGREVWVEATAPRWRKRELRQTAAALASRLNTDHEKALARG